MQIKIENIKKAFGEKVAVDIEKLQIEGRGIIGLVGNNGAGKTTLFRLLLDLLKLDQGDINLTFDGDNQKPIIPSLNEEWKQHTGAYLDEGFLIDFLSAEEYFSFVGKASGLKQREIDGRLAEFSLFMAGEVLGQKKLIRDFSAGNKQKIGIVAAMFPRPQLLILDEPFNFLDPSSQNNLKQLLSHYADETNATIILSSHNLQHTIDISKRILLLEHGRIIADIDNADSSAASAIERYFNNPSTENLS